MNRRDGPKQSKTGKMRAIRRGWSTWKIGRRMRKTLDLSFTPRLTRIKELKIGRAYDLWLLEGRRHGRSPKAEKTKKTGRCQLVLKVFKQPSRRRSRTEISVYERSRESLKPLLPAIIAIKEAGGKCWIFMERVPPLAGRIDFTPETFFYIMPVIAELHARTRGHYGGKPPKALRPWIPVWTREVEQRRRQVEKTLLYLSRAISLNHLEGLLLPHFDRLREILTSGPRFFPVLDKSEHGLVHGDLHSHNICSHPSSDPLKGEWDLRLIDWEGASFAPVWLDLAVLVEILIDFRTDWRDREQSIRRTAVDAYVKAMKERGLQLKGDPLERHKMAYLQRTLEKGLRIQLRRELHGRRGELLPRYVEKIATWGEELL